MLGVLARITRDLAPWYRMPFFLAIPVIIGHRTNLRQHNLFDTERDPSLLAPQGDGSRSDERGADGSFNDRGCPWMGMAGARFGRNVPIRDTFRETDDELFTPNPRVISRRLLARKEFIPVPHLNVLVAAWLQFMVHDWLSHGPNDTSREPFNVDFDTDDDWPYGRIKVLQTTRDDKRCTADDGQPATFRNTETHWWDASQIYGSSLERQLAVRTDPATGRLCDDGKIYLDSSGLLPVDPGGKLPNVELTGVNGNWWVGLSVMHTLFAREHNAIVDRLRVEYPAKNSEWLFQKARLINAGLIVKIHTVEWTPALLNSAEGRFAMRGNWWGILGEHYKRAYGHVGSGDFFSGIPGSETDHHTAPYAITEEFTAVYRMHSLLPDEFSVRRHADDSTIATLEFLAVSGGGVRDLYTRAPFSDVLYSLATSHPGALVLHNYPSGLRHLNKKESEGIFIDLATVDVLRDRERGVPRYCEFRRLFGMRAPRSFEELTANPTWRAELQSIYDTIEDVDLLVGTLAEEAPPGFGFSDTAFRVFSLMASRRLKSDRFYTTDFTPETYTPVGFEWITNNSFRSLLTRHCPELAPRFGDLRNVFFPWDRA
jgi:hypothetical protein